MLVYELNRDQYKEMSFYIRNKLTHVMTLNLKSQMKYFKFPWHKFSHVHQESANRQCWEREGPLNHLKGDWTNTFS